ncbi:MAG: hypothetical protein WBX25_36660 [Rhodomicrobium sp.]
MALSIFASRASAESSQNDNGALSQSVRQQITELEAEIDRVEMNAM